MNKLELIKEISHKCDVTQASAKDVLNATLHSIAEALDKGETVKLVGFGSFSLSLHKERNCYHPQTGKTMTIPAQNRIRFKASDTLIDKVNGSAPVSGKNNKKSVALA